MSEWALFFNDHTCVWEEWPVPGTSQRAMPYETREPVMHRGCDWHEEGGYGFQKYCPACKREPVIDDIGKTNGVWQCGRCGFDMPVSALHEVGADNVCKDRESCDARTDGQAGPDGATIFHARQVLGSVIDEINDEAADLWPGAEKAVNRLKHVDRVLELLQHERGRPQRPLEAVRLDRLERRVLTVEQNMIRAGLSFRDTIPRAGQDTDVYAQEPECQHDMRPVGGKAVTPDVVEDRGGGQDYRLGKP